MEDIALVRKAEEKMKEVV